MRNSASISAPPSVLTLLPRYRNFQGLVLNSYGLVGIGIDPHDSGLPDVDTEDFFGGGYTIMSEQLPQDVSLSSIQNFLSVDKIYEEWRLLLVWNSLKHKDPLCV